MNLHHKKRNAPIQSKIFWSMTFICAVVIILMTAAVSAIIYVTMRNQTVYSQQMVIGWYEEKLEMRVRNYLNDFYKFEVGDVKTSVYSWSTDSDSGYDISKRLTNTMNTILNFDNGIEKISLFGLSDENGLIARRSGVFKASPDLELLTWWEENKPPQTNICFRELNGFVLCLHQINHFETGKPLALLVFTIRPDYLFDNVKTAPNESFFVFNDRNNTIFADISDSDEIDPLEAIEVAEIMKKEGKAQLQYKKRFYFYRPISGGKLQVLQTLSYRTIINTMRATLATGAAAAVISVLSAILFSAFFAKSYGGQLTANDYKMRIEKRDAQIQALQAQMNPHFIYNTLQVIGGMALKHNVRPIYDISTKLSDIMRYSIDFSNDMVCLEKEISYLENYISILNQRFEDRLKLTVDINDSLKACFVPKLILQPVVENSFEHGLAEKEGGWEINICSHKREDNLLLLSITDNGIGIDKEKLVRIMAATKRGASTRQSLSAKAHIGLSNVAARICLKYPEPCGLTIDSVLGEWTRVDLLLQYEEV